MALDRRLQQLEAGRVDRIPGFAELGDIEPVAGDRLGAVIDGKYETRGENPQAEGTQEEADHGGFIGFTKDEPWRRARVTYGRDPRATPPAVAAALIRLPN